MRVKIRRFLGKNGIRRKELNSFRGDSHTLISFPPFDHIPICPRGKPGNFLLSSLFLTTQPCTHTRGWWLCPFISIPLIFQTFSFSAATPLSEVFIISSLEYCNSLLYSFFFIGTVTNYHELSGLKQHKALGENSFPCLLQFLEATCIPWLKPLSPSFRVNNVASLTILLQSHLPLITAGKEPPLLSIRVITLGPLG